MLRITAIPVESPRKSATNGLTGVAAALLITSLLGGCRGAAYRDVYQQKMASEIRILEDQLYEADYQNQVLRDEVLRAQMNAAQVVVPDHRPRRSFLGKTLNESGEVIDTPRPDGIRSDNTRSQSRQLENQGSDEQFDLPAWPLDNSRSRRQPTPAALGDPQPAEGFTPPSEPVPPGIDDLMIPDVELGEPMPPPADALQESLPGKIELPESVKMLDGAPELPPVSIRINPGLSGGHKSDDSPETEGIILVIEGIDEAGKQVKLENFDIDANVSIVLLDPSRPGTTARLGKWDFGPEEIRERIKADNGLLGSSLQIVVPWGQERPEASTVIAHVRLGSDDVMMQTQAEIATAQPAMAQWTPRATKTR